MPATPKVSGVLRLIGRVEVDRQVEAHKHCHTDGNIGIAREVGINLQGVEHQSREILEGGEEIGVFEDAVHEAGGKIVGKDQFLYQSVDNPKDGDAELAAGKEEGFVELRDELIGAKNGACNKLGEEGGVETKVEDVGDVRNLAFVDVDDITDVLEGKEGNADGEENLDGDGVFCAESGVEDVSEKIGVLEETEDAEVDCNTDGAQELASGGGEGVVHADAERPAQEGGEDEQQNEETRGLVIKEETEEE